MAQRVLVDLDPAPWSPQMPSFRGSGLFITTSGARTGGITLVKS